MITLRREVRPGDREAVAGLVRATGCFDDAEVAVAVELVDEHLAKGEASGYLFLFADDAEGRLLGYACWGPIPATRESFDLYWIAVLPGQDGRGLGTRLLTEVERLVRADGGRRLYIETSERSCYAPARGFYERRGCRLEARLEDFYAPGDSKLIYLKMLS